MTRAEPLLGETVSLHHRSIARLTLVAVAALVAAPALAPVAAATGPADGKRGAEPNRGITVDTPDTLLKAPAHGRAAVTRLGDDLPVAAALNGLTPAGLTRLLRTDSTAWVDNAGALFYIDPVPDRAIPDHPGPAPTASPGSSEAPLADTFLLHSKPGSTRTIFLDLDGGDVTGTFWNSDYGVATSHPAWDPSGDGAGFNDTERAQVQKIWAMVAEDYAPWDVDVTTQDPGLAALTRSSSSDFVYGTRALITPSTDAAGKICGGGCGGVAYVNVFNAVVGAASPFDPAWVFPHLLGNGPKAIAEATTHEVGHNFGLDHDGNATQGYDSGHGAWAPIMGVGYNNPVVQFSKGDYAGANNQEDDLSIIARSVDPRTDEAGDTVGTAASLPVAGTSAFITSRGDVDAFQVGTCSAGATIEVTPDATSANLDVGARLLSSSGTVLASADPAATKVAFDRATGLDATLTVPTAGSGYVVTVDGVGYGTWATGYDDYASLGAYTLRTTGCSTAGTPGRPTSVTATPDPVDPRITLAWSPPTSTGTSAVTGYVATISGSATPVTLPASARSHTFTGLAPGTAYDVSVAAVNGAGTGPGATARATTASAVTAPGTPRNLAARWDAPTNRTQVSWDPPTSDGGAAITAYQLLVDAVSVGSVSATTNAVTLDGITPGSHVVAVRAVNSIGTGAAASTPVTVGSRPANDDFAAAQVLSGASGTTSGDNANATSESDDPMPPGAAVGAGGHSVWYAWTAPATGTASFTTGSSDPARDTTLAVYTGARGSLTQVAGNDDQVGSVLAAVELPITAGITYRLAVDGFPFTGGTGPFDLTWSSVPTPRAPGAPTGVGAVAADRAALVSWTPGGAGSSPTTGYTVTSSPGGVSGTVGAGARSTTLTGLTNGTAYTFNVVATNAVGSSPASLPSTPVTPAGVPVRPSGVAATGGDASAVVTWTPGGANGSPITGYAVTSSPGGITRTVAGTATAASITGLTNGTAYTFTVVATNAVGSSAASLPSAPVTPVAVPTATAPSRVAKPTATVRRGVVRLAWTAPSANGSPITAYQVLGAGRRTVTVAAPTTKAALKRLQPGLYRLKVVAINAVGPSPASPAVRVRLR